MTLYSSLHFPENKLPINIIGSQFHESSVAMPNSKTNLTIFAGSENMDPSSSALNYAIYWLHKFGKF